MQWSHQLRGGRCAERALSSVWRARRRHLLRMGRVSMLSLYSRYRPLESYRRHRVSISFFDAVSSQHEYSRRSSLHPSSQEGEAIGPLTAATSKLMSYTLFPSCFRTLVVPKCPTPAPLVLRTFRPERNGSHCSPRSLAGTQRQLHLNPRAPNLGCV